MKKYPAVIKNIILILFSAILFLCTACTPIDPVISEPTLEIPKEEPYLSTVLEITENSSSDYSIICSREDASLTAAIMLHEAVLNATGASLPVLIDETAEVSMVRDENTSSLLIKSAGSPQPTEVTVNWQ